MKLGQLADKKTAVSVFLRSTLNELIAARIESGQLNSSRINMVEVNNICDGGLRLLNVLRALPWLFVKLFLHNCHNINHFRPFSSDCNIWIARNVCCVCILLFWFFCFWHFNKFIVQSHKGQGANHKQSDSTTKTKSNSLHNPAKMFPMTSVFLHHLLQVCCSDWS